MSRRPAAPGGPRGRSRRRVWFLPALLLLLAGGGAVYAWWTLQRPYKGFAGARIEVVVKPGTGARRILADLETAGVLADARLARLYLVYRLEDPPLKAGVYGFEGAATTPQVLAKLIRGEVVTHQITLVEGLTLDETAHVLADAGFGDLAALARVVRDPTPVLDLDPEATDLEGYLFPDTYNFAAGAPAGEVVGELVANFRAKLAKEVRPLLEPGGELGLRRLVILASIVEKEARLDEERPLIAAVYANRLKKGVGLYADPTIIYALKRLGRWDGNLRRPDLDLESPYNTYRVAGLPPGPICSPGLASLRAAARPADVPYLYFVSRNDGSHVFSSTLAEHSRNVERWQKRYWRQRWSGERKGNR